MNRIAVVALATLFLGAGAAHAQALKTYDNFGESEISSTLWDYGEVSRGIKSKALQMSQRGWSSTTSSTGTSISYLNEGVINPSAVNEMKVTVTVNSLTVAGCAADPSVTGFSRARIIGAFFNTGTPVPGDETNDVLAQISVGQQSGVGGPYTIYGDAFVCTSSTCETPGNSVAYVALGSTNAGTPVTVTLQWDQPSHSFTFASTASGGSPVTIPYMVSDVNPPSEPFKDMQIRMDIPNCVGATPLEGSVNATFDNFQVNKSAAP